MNKDRLFLSKQILLMIRLDLKIDDLPMDDRLTYDLICSGELAGIFQNRECIGNR